jgi:hypothetical protein
MTYLVTGEQNEPEGKCQEDEVHGHRGLRFNRQDRGMKCPEY